MQSHHHHHQRLVTHRLCGGQPETNCSFDWSLKTYTKTRRSQGPNREGLIRNKKLLAKILEAAPTGRPGLIVLKESWLHLHRKYNIMDKRPTSASMTGQCSVQIVSGSPARICWI